MKATRLFPDPEGEIEVYETIWEIESEVEKCVPPILVYADLIINEDKKISKQQTKYMKNISKNFRGSG